MSELILGESLEVLIDNRGKNPPYTESGIPVISAKAIKNGRILLEEARRISQETYGHWMSTKLNRHDVILTSEAPLGECALVEEDAPLATAQRLYALRGRKGVLDSRYLYYAFKTQGVQADLHSRASGTTVTGIRQPELLKVRIPNPGYTSQLAIAEVLGALDDKIAVNESIAATALEMAESRYINAALLQNWKSITLGSAGRWLSGGTPKTNEAAYWGGDIPWISALSLKSPWIDDSDRRLTITGAQSGTRLVPAESVIFVVRGSSLKTEFRIGITQRQVAFGQDCKAIIASPEINAHILFHSIRSRTPEILEMVDETSIGAGRLSTDLISKLEVRVPEEGNRTNVELRSLDDLAATQQRESRTLASLRDTLLPELMSGRLRVREAERIVEDAL